MSANPTRLLDPETMFIQALGFQYSGRLLNAAHEAHRQLAPPAEMTVEQIQHPGMTRALNLYIVNSAIVSGLPCMVPTTVLIAFAAELYLKCLLVINGATNLRDHDLLNLYDRLLPAQKQRLEELFQASFADNAFLIAHQAEMQATHPGIVLNMRECVAGTRRAFVEFRYVYENGTEGSLSSFIGAPLRKYIIEDKPEWQKHVDAIGMLPSMLGFR
jgi:hypothetical protein